MNRFSITDSLDEECWNKFVYEHPKGSIFHTSYMVDVFRGTKNHSPFFLAALSNTREVLALLVSVRVQTLPDPLGKISSRSIFYAEPICREDPQGVEALSRLLAEHDAQRRNDVLFAEVRPLGIASQEKIALERCGYEYKDYLNFLLDLRLPADELWRNMRKTCRSDIRRSHKKGVKIEDVTSEQGVNILYQLLHNTYVRAKVPLADKSLFAKAFKILNPRAMIKIFVAYHEQIPVAASVVLLYKKTIYEWYWGIDRTEAISILPGECLAWHEIEWGHQQHYELFDFGGAGWPDRPYGVRDFKAKFGGDLVNLGRYRKVYSPWKFALAEKAYDLIRNVARPRVGHNPMNRRIE